MKNSRAILNPSQYGEADCRKELDEAIKLIRRFRNIWAGGSIPMELRYAADDFLARHKPSEEA